MADIFEKVTPRLTEIDENEALLYMGYRGGGLSAGIRADLARCRALVMETARPRAVWRVFDRLPDGSLAGTAFRPAGRDAQALLADCGQVVVMAATLGAEIDALLRAAQVRNMADAVMIDALSSAAIENVCDNLCADWGRAAAPLYLTDRFSPGYGDMPFSQQGELCGLLDTSRRLGVSLTPGGLMTPQKSVAALLGVSPRPQPRRSRGCAACAMFDGCAYRKDGKTCEKF